MFLERAKESEREIEREKEKKRERGLNLQSVLVRRVEFSFLATNTVLSETHTRKEEREKKKRERAICDCWKRERVDWGEKDHDFFSSSSSRINDSS